jgi:hypothetical protein
VPLSATYRVSIVLGVLAAIVAACAGIYVHSRRVALSAANTEPPLDILTQSAKPTAETSSILSHLPADAPALAYIDVAELRKLQGSPLAALLGLINTEPQEDRDYRQFVRETGFDYSRDLDRVALAYWLAGGAGANTLAGKALVIADGRFNEQKIEAYALKSGHVVTLEKQTAYEIPGTPAVAFKFLSPTRIELASGKNPVELLTVSASRKDDPDSQGHFGAVAGAPIFAVARTDKLSVSFYESFKQSPQVESLARSVRSLALAGQPGGDILRVALDGETTSVTNALEITTLLDISRMGASMALSDPKSRAQMTEQQGAFLDALVRQLKITHQGRWVRLRLDVTPEMMVAATSSHSSHSHP